MSPYGTPLFAAVEAVDTVTLHAGADAHPVADTHVHVAVAACDNTGVRACTAAKAGASADVVAKVCTNAAAGASGSAAADICTFAEADVSVAMAMAGVGGVETAAVTGVVVDAGVQTGADTAGAWPKASMAVEMAPLAAPSASHVSTSAATLAASGKVAANVCTYADAGVRANAVANACTVAEAGASGNAVANACTLAKTDASTDAVADVRVAVDMAAPVEALAGVTSTQTATRRQPLTQQPPLPVEKWHPPSLHSGDTSQLLASSTATSGPGSDSCNHWKQQLVRACNSKSKVRRKQRKAAGRLAIVCHNACSLSSLKLQHSRDLLLQYDRSAAPVLCFQETWLPQFDCSNGDKAVHVARTKQQGGGILTLVPASVPLQA